MNERSAATGRWLARCWRLVLGVLVALCFQAPTPSDAATNTTVVPRGNRILGIAANEAQNGDFGAAFTLAKGAGMRATPLSVYWDDLEPAPGVYNPSVNWLAIANAFYPPNATSVLLVVVPIDTVQNRMPADLHGLALDDPQVITRFQRLLDYIFTQIPALQLVALSIGNEVDVYFGADATLWNEYTRFFAATAAYARLQRPGLQVGVKTTYNGAVVTAREQVGRLNQASDTVLVTYYPCYDNFTVKAPTLVPADFAALVSAFPSKPIMLAELGYPSSLLLNSSQTKQKTFIDYVFKAWDTYHNRIQLILFERLHDLSAAEAQAQASAYGPLTPQTAAFFETLGLRTYAGAGTAKAAFRALQTHTKARGW